MEKSPLLKKFSGDDSINIFTIGDATKIKSSAKVRLWIFDPPYNIGYRYKKVKDSLPWNEYEDLISKSCLNMLKHSHHDASLVMINYPSQSARLLPIIEDSGWTLHQMIAWVYPSNIGHSSRKFTTAQRTISWYRRTTSTPYFDVKAVVQPYKNPNDKRIKERIVNGSLGVNLYDWWEINLRKNVSQGYVGWANQLPTELIRRLVLTMSQPGDMVGDLMAGGGTTFEVCKELDRSVWLNDIDESALDIWKSL